jgi:hypothetical protein
MDTPSHTGPFSFVCLCKLNLVLCFLTRWGHGLSARHFISPLATPLLPITLLGLLGLFASGFGSLALLSLALSQREGEKNQRVERGSSVTVSTTPIISAGANSTLSGSSSSSHTPHPTSTNISNDTHLPKRPSADTKSSSTGFNPYDMGAGGGEDNEEETDSASTTMSSGKSRGVGAPVNPKPLKLGEKRYYPFHLPFASRSPRPLSPSLSSTLHNPSPQRFINPLSPAERSAGRVER